MSQSGNVTLDEEEKRLDLERQRLSLDKEREELEQQKRLHELDLAKQKALLELEVEERRTLLKQQQEQSTSQRVITSRAFIFKVIASIFLMGSGFYLTVQKDNLGPYLMGTGAGGAGIEAVKALQGGKDEQKKDEGPAAGGSPTGAPPPP